MKKYIYTFTTFLFFMLSTFAAKAASVTCMFDYGNSYQLSTGNWVGTADFDSIFDMFGDYIEFDLDNSLLEKLDSQEIFKAGTTNNGDVFLYGGEMGIEGKLSTIKDGLLNVYSGYCDVGFGWYCKVK